MWTGEELQSPLFLSFFPPRCSLLLPPPGAPSLPPVFSDHPQVQCVRTYKASQPDELTLEKTDILAVRMRTSDGERALPEGPPGGGFFGQEGARQLSLHGKK